jgi:hypothetical protein
VYRNFAEISQEYGKCQWFIHDIHLSYCGKNITVIVGRLYRSLWKADRKSINYGYFTHFQETDIHDMTFCIALVNKT